MHVERSRENARKEREKDARAGIPTHSATPAPSAVERHSVKPFFSPASMTSVSSSSSSSRTTGGCQARARTP